jgi:hypothetical protein
MLSVFNWQTLLIQIFILLMCKWWIESADSKSPSAKMRKKIFWVLLILISLVQADAIWMAYIKASQGL